MMLRHPLISLFGALLLWAALPVVADSPDFDAPFGLGPAHGVYLGDSRMLTASPARQLTLRARISDFDYSPTGEKIVYRGLVIDHQQTWMAVKIVDTWRSEPVEKTIAKGGLFGPQGEDPADTVQLAGWSGDGRYVLIQHITPVADAAAPSNEDKTADQNITTGLRPLVNVEYECVDTQGDVSDPKLVSTGQMPSQTAFAALAWSPSHTRALLCSIPFNNGREVTMGKGDVEVKIAATVYRPDDDSRLSIVCPPEEIPMGWLDEQSLLMRKLHAKRGEKIKYSQYDIASGTETEIPLPTEWRYGSPVSLGLYQPEILSANPKSPDLILEVAPHRLPGAGTTDKVDASSIWVRRASGKKFAAMPIGVTPGSNPPAARWSPAGEEAAFIAHGDLFVTDFTKRTATARERLDAGESLDCKEENLLAASSLKQIGLGLIQYAQDYDGRLPPASDVNDRVYPYIQDESVFSVGDSKFQYRGNDSMITSNLDSPSTLIIGEMDTPCAHNYVYMDGHVKSIAK